MSGPDEPEDLELQLGEHLRQLRLLQDLDQRTLAERAGVALGAVRRLEAGAGSTVRTLVRVLRCLGRAEWIGTLAPRVSISPLQLLERPEPRRRASRRKRRRG